jgi:hypothetical protein
LAIGHFEFKETMELVSQFLVATTLKYMKDFVRSCNVCVQANNLHHHLHGLLQPSSIHASPWSSISMDFITNLPSSSFYDSILVVVDHLMNMIHFIPCTKTIIGEITTKLFIDHVFWYHGFLEDIIFYYGPQFASKF